MARIDTSAAADIRFYCGSTGSGKSHQIKAAVRDARRLLVFDPDDEYSHEARCRRVTSIAELAKAVPRKLSAPFRLAFVGHGVQQFEQFCRVAWLAQDARNPLTVAVDELAGVDRVSKAHGSWHQLVTRGRKYRTSIHAGAQAAVEISKTLMRQRSYLWIGYLAEKPDHEYIEERTRIPAEAVADLRGRPHFDAIELANGRPPYLIRDGRRTEIRTK